MLQYKYRSVLAHGALGLQCLGSTGIIYDRRVVSSTGIRSCRSIFIHCFATIYDI